jgi:hypothetical protein
MAIAPSILFYSPRGAGSHLDHEWTKKWTLPSNGRSLNLL